MIFRFLTIYWYFLVSVIVSLLGLKNHFKKLYYCGKNIERITYRLPDKSKDDILISLRIYKEIFFNSIKHREPYKKNNDKNHEAIFDGGLMHSKLRFDYVEQYSNVKNDLLISKGHLIHYINPLTFLLTSMLLFFSFVPVFLISLFSKNKYHLPFYVKELLECFYLSEILHRNKIEKINYFCIYQRDANICAYILMKLGVYVNKIPSEVPLFFWNNTIIADQLSCCFAYQKEEYETYKETMFVEKVELWAPEKILLAPTRFLSEERKASVPSYDIGFFSSGNWLRHKIGNVDLGHNNNENEELILQLLVDYTLKHSLTLRLFIHPLEKKEKYKKDTSEYYSSILKYSNITLADEMLPSIEGFDEINIAVSLYSTLMFERVYLGFKTILAPFDYDEFPIKASGLDNICVKNKRELDKKLDESLKLTTKEFFSLNKLDKYSELV